MWKDFFYYSKSERRAVYILSILIVIFVIGSIMLPNYVKTEGESVSEEEFLHFEKQIQNNNIVYDKRPLLVNERKIELKFFDPNTLDSIGLLDLGLSPFVVRNILKYRDKGGRFVSPESFSRIYGMTEERFSILKPYICISEQFMYHSETAINKPVLKQRDTIRRIFKYPEGTLVDVGVADTLELMKIPGIGIGIAKSIVAYRNKLGGFYKKEQILEVKYVTPELMKWFKLDSLSLHKISVNKADIDKLRAHPYINFYQAKVIVDYRKKMGKIKSLSQLSLYEEFTEKDLKRLAPYFLFD